VSACCRYQAWLLCLCGVGWAADILDVQAVAYLIPALINDWQESRARLGLAASFTFVGMLFGSLFWGVISDRYGRRPAFMLTSLCAGACGMGASVSKRDELQILPCKTRGIHRLTQLSAGRRRTTSTC
jgi:AAHS family 4-hydroxybenzoate transporter-like MFS transporter